MRSPGLDIRASMDADDCGGTATFGPLSPALEPLLAPNVQWGDVTRRLELMSVRLGDKRVGQ